MIVSLLRNAVPERLLSVSDQAGRKTRAGRKLTEKTVHTPPALKSPCSSGLHRKDSWMEFAWPRTCRFYQLPCVLSREITSGDTGLFNL